MSGMCCSVLELASPFDTCLTRRYEDWGRANDPGKPGNGGSAIGVGWGGTTVLSDASHVRTEGEDEARCRGARHSSNRRPARQGLGAGRFPRCGIHPGENGVSGKDQGEVVI